MNSVRAFSSLPSITNVSVIGAGVMGSGIAQVALQASMNVTLVDRNDEILQKAQRNIAAGLKLTAKKKKADSESYVANALKRMSLSTDPIKGSQGKQLVIEAIFEHLPTKRSLFAQLDAALPPDTVIASNTSSIRISEIASECVHKERIGGMHFFIPVPFMLPVEIVRTQQTSDHANDVMHAFVTAAHKTPIQCKDTPAFVINRLLLPMFAEAIKMYERGDATIADIDTAMKLGAGFPIGPFELADFCGLDIMLAVLESLRESLPHGQYQVESSPTLQRLVQEGKLGKKTGAGWYNYDSTGAKL